MSESISLKAVESRAFRAAVHDGLWDVFLGCFALQFGLAPLLSRSLGDFWSSAVFLPAWGLLYIAIRLIRKHILAPRVGVMKFGAARKTILVRVNLVVLVILLVSAGLGTISAFYVDAMPGWLTSALLGLIFLTCCGVGAHVLEFPHLYLYGAMLALSPLVGEWLWTNLGVPHHGWPVTFGITGVVIITTGLVRFFRILRENPIPVADIATEEVHDDRNEV